MNIRVDLNYTIKDGTEVVFRSPVDCSQITGLIVYYNGEGKEFAFADAHGNNVGDIDHLFAENVAVKVILDVTTGMAFVQNADTNAYLEGRFAEGVTHTPQKLTQEQKEQARANIGAAKDGLSPKYDLKDGYAYTEGIYIAENGTETTLTGQNYKCVDYIPVLGGVSYTMYGVGYALYNNDKVFLYAVIDETGTNRIREFTPTTGGYVRLTINSQDISYARFCRTSEKYREIWEYEPDVSPFFNPRVPCDVHLYGDSNSEGYGLTDTSKAWSNRLGALITSLPTRIYNYRFLCFADKGESRYPILNADGYCRFTAYTHFFEVSAANVGEIAVHIDGQAVESLTSDNSTKTYAVTEGLHTVELFGVSGENRITGIVSGKNRSFTNHAVFGYASTTLPATPEGSIVIVMFGTNDRMLYPGQPHTMLWNFRKACVDRGVIPYFFTPIPTDTTGEKSEYYQQEIDGVISELPPDCINIYEDLQLVEVLTGESIFGDALHLNERGHALLYAIAASKLQLAALSSEIEELVKPKDDSRGSYKLLAETVLPEAVTQISWTQTAAGESLTKYKDFFIVWSGKFTATANEAFICRSNNGGMFHCYLTMQKTANATVGGWFDIREIYVSEDGKTGIVQSTCPTNFLKNMIAAGSISTQGLSDNNRTVNSDMAMSDGNYAPVTSISFGGRDEAASQFAAGTKAMLFGRAR